MLARVPKPAEKNLFLKLARNITSQNGEDGIIEHLFEVSLADINKSETLLCIDIGAWDGKHLSNTYNLIRNKCWSGLLFEANKERCNEMKQLYQSRLDVKCIDTFVEFEGENSLSTLLKQNGVLESTPIHFLSIDVDGNDYHLWDSLNTSYKPQVVCIEFNPTIPNRVLFIQERDMRVHQGSSIAALNELAIQKGYSLICTTTFNAFFLRNDLIQFVPNFDRTIDALHSSDMSTDFFQTYDGELKFFGPSKLLWHRLAINPQKLQVLPQSQRRFPFAPPTLDQLEPLQSSLQALKNNATNCSIEIAVQNCINLFSVPHLEGIALDAIDSIIWTLKSPSLPTVASANETGTNANTSFSNFNFITSSKIDYLAHVITISKGFLNRGDYLFARDHIKAESYYKRVYYLLNPICDDAVYSVDFSLRRVCVKLSELALQRNDWLESEHWSLVFRKLPLLIDCHCNSNENVTSTCADKNIYDRSEFPARNHQGLGDSLLKTVNSEMSSNANSKGLATNLPVPSDSLLESMEKLDKKRNLKCVKLASEVLTMR